MSAGVLDAGVVLGWLHGGHRSATRLERLFTASRRGTLQLYVSTVHLTEVLRVFAPAARRTGVDAVSVLRATGVEIHAPDEEVARRAATLPASLGDAFAAATALVLRARLHTTDAELVRQLRGTSLPVTRY